MVIDNLYSFIHLIFPRIPVRNIVIHKTKEQTHRGKKQAQIHMHLTSSTDEIQTGIEYKDVHGYPPNPSL